MSIEEFPKAPRVPIFMSIGTFVESKLIIGNEKSNDLIVGKDTDTFCKGQWDFDTPKIIFPYLNTPTRIAEKFGMTMYDPITNQKGWVLSDAIMNNMIIFDDKSGSLLETKFIELIDEEMIGKNWEGVYLNQSELHNHISLLRGMKFKKISAMYDPISSLFSTSFECHVCGCPCEEVITKPCHGCGEEDPLLNTGLSIDEESLNWSLGKEWE